MAATRRPRYKSRDRNLIIALSLAALIVVAVIYYEAPNVVSPHTSTTSSTSTAGSGAYLTEYGNADNWAWSSVTNLSPSDAAALAENSFNSYPTQTSPFLAGGASLQVGLDGFSYIANVGNYELYGMNIETQDEVYDVALPNSPLTPLPYVTPFFHLAATTTIGSTPEVWVSTPWDGIYAFPYVNANSANYGFNMTTPAVGQDGNEGTYSWAAPNFAIDQTRSIMVAGPMVNTTGIPGRGYVQGYKIGSPTNVALEFSLTQINVTSATPIWQTWLSPPQNGSASSWEAQQVSTIPHVWEFNGTSAIDLKTLSASALSSIISDDWTAHSGNATFSTGPETNSSWIADPANDMTYIMTSAPETTSLTSSFDGPALFSSSIVALDTSSGTIQWTFQFTPHDVWGWGCTGNIAMIPATIGGTSQEVIAKQCENGYLFLLNPTTGALIYSGQVPGVVRAPGAQIPNVQNSTQMTESLASVSGANSTQQPVVLTAANIAYDPSDNLLLGAVGQGSDTLGSEAPFPSSWNSTAYAFDPNALNFEWQAPVSDLDFSYISIANGVAYMGTYQGAILVANTSNGSQLELIHAAMAVTSLFVEDGVHGQAGLIAGGYSITTKQLVQTLLYTPGGLGLVPT